MTGVLPWGSWTGPSPPRSSWWAAVSLALKALGCGCEHTSGFLSCAVAPRPDGVRPYGRRFSVEG